MQVSEVRSYYWWQGETHSDPEFLLTLKTTSGSVPGFEELLASQHSYDEPELIVLPIIAGSDTYLQWIAESTGAQSSSAAPAPQGTGSSAAPSG